MVSIIKNQILKHLEKFAKNLCVDNINVNTWKGEGELNSLELNEIVLTDLLELPTWMKMTSATCNKVKFKIPFTKIKTTPIELNLDDVQIIVETCEVIRSTSMDSGLSAYTMPSKYNYISKIVDGITVNINSVTLEFISPAFIASIHILKVSVESKSPAWKKADLKETFLKNKAKGVVLIFKELTWDTVKIEARSTNDKSLPPIRLLTNQAKCRITLKKRLSDSFVLGSRLALILDDLLWVLTDSQLTAALHFLDSLSGLVQQANEVSRRMKAARKLEELPEYHAQLAQQQHFSPQNIERPTAFTKHDVVETSYHFFCKKLAIHLSDDPGEGRSIHPDLKSGGAWQINLVSFRLDFYPYHLASSDRLHWWKYTDTTPHFQWLTQAQQSFKSQLVDIIERVRNNQQRMVMTNSTYSNGSNPGTPTVEAPRKSFSTPVKDRMISQLSKLMTTCAVIRIGDFTFYKVTTKKDEKAQEFIRGDSGRRNNVPGGDILLHAEFTYYYYPGDIKFPLPSPKFYVQLNPIVVTFDLTTLLWLNAFALNLHRNLMLTATVTAATNTANNDDIYFDVKIEAIMMKIILECVDEPIGTRNRDRPRSLHGFVSRTTLTNTRSSEWGCSRADLAKCIHACQLGSLFYSTSFPSNNNDFHLVTEKFLKHAEGTDNIRPDASQVTEEELPETFSDMLSQELLWTECKDIWCIKLEPIWAEFYTSLTATPQTAVPFLDNFPLTVWAHTKPMFSSEDTPVPGAPRRADIHAIAYISNLISVQINHYQVLFLLRLAEEFSELVTFLNMDAKHISGKLDTSIVLGALIPQLELTCVLPAQSSGKDSSGIDVDSSVVPDSSSLATAGGGSVQWNPVLATHIPSSPPPREEYNDMIRHNRAAKEIANHEIIQYQETQRSNNIFTFVHQNGGNVINHDKKIDTITPTPKHEPPLIPPRQQQETTPKPKRELFQQNTFDNMKKGFKELVTNMNIKTQQSMIPDDDSDSLSIRTDISDDSDAIDALAEMGDNDSMFGASGVLEGIKVKTDLAFEAFPEDEPPITPATTTCSERDSIASSCRRKDVISVVTFKLGRVEFLQQSEGFASSIKVQVTSIANEECAAIPWDEFQSKFSMRSRGWDEIDTDGLEDGIEPRVKLRFDHIVNPQSPDTWMRRNPGLWFQDFINVKLCNIDLKMALNVVGGLAELVEDEIEQMPLPVQITLDNINIHLWEEKIPPMPPIIACIDRLKIRKGIDGKVFVEPNLTSNSSLPRSLTPSQISTSSNEQQQRSNQDLKSEIEQLRRRLIAMEKLNEENHQLRKYQEESQKLRSYLNTSQEEVFKLEEENKNLLQLIKDLKNEAIQSEIR